MRVYEALADGLAEVGAEVVFGMMGEGNLELISTMTARGRVRYFGARHEAGAIGMADGYARVSGKVGVCSVTQGPGITNGLTALTAAARYRSSIVVIAPDTPVGEDAHPQKLDLRALAQVIDVPIIDLVDPDEVGETLSRAYDAAWAGPVILRVPNDVQKLEAGPLHVHVARREPPLRQAADPRAVSAVADALEAAERPIIVGGRGAVLAGARDELTALADRIGGLLATSLQAKGWFGGHPFEIGIFGGFAHPLAFELIEEADCVVAFGASLNSWQTKNGTLLSGCTVVQCDVDPAAFGRFAAADVEVLGDAGLTAAAVLAELEQRGVAGPGFRTPEVTRRLADRDPSAEFVDEGRPGELDPRAAVIAVDRALPRDRTLVVDGGLFTGYPCTYISVPEPSAFVFAIDFGSTGLGLGVALGAAVARPDRRTVLVVGDGGLLMSIADLETAVRYELPLTLVVLNDRAYGSEVHHLRARGLPTESACHSVPPLDGIARSLGGKGVSISTPEELSMHEAWSTDLPGPMLIDVQINGDVSPGWFAAFAAHAAEAGHWT